MEKLFDLARAVAAAVQADGRTVAVSESITAGTLATALAAAPEASTWFRGSIVAYHTDMKRDVLGVTSAAIISRECAREMAEGALRLTGADLVVATTGVGGPDPEEGKPAGTVVICAGTSDDLRVFDHDFAGSPDEVVEQAALEALRHLQEAAR
jgi:nicotinamide-nucleotide amidase